MKSETSSTLSQPRSQPTKRVTPSASERLTNSEIAQLRQNGRALSDFAQKAFSGARKRA